MFSVASPQKVQESDCLIPILYRKSLVAIRLCRNLNLNSLSFGSLVHQNGNEYVLSQLKWSYCWGVILTRKRSLKNSFSIVKMTPDIEELK